MYVYASWCGQTNVDASLSQIEHAQRLLVTHIVVREHIDVPRRKPHVLLFTRCCDSAPWYNLILASLCLYPLVRQW